MNAELTRVRDELLRLQAEARALGQHQVAYHALAGAMHAAEGEREPAALQTIEELSREYGRWIDQNEPLHPLSSRSASARGHHSIFEQLAAMCVAVRTRLKAEQRTRRPNS